LGKIRNPNFEIRNKLEFRMTEIQNFRRNALRDREGGCSDRFEHLKFVL